MDSSKDQPTSVCHVVAVPYPGRGHINPMMNLCKLLASHKADILITFVVTEEWHGFIGSEAKPNNVRFATVPNVIPSELVRAADMDGFIEAIMTNMEAPFERLLGRLEQPPVLIVADTFLPWAIRVGNRRNVPAASFWPMPASVFSVFQHFHLLAENGHFPVDLLGDYSFLCSSFKFVKKEIILLSCYHKILFYLFFIFHCKLSCLIEFPFYYFN